MTPSHLSEASQPSGCPCGRSHPARRAFRTDVRKPAATDLLRTRVYDAGLSVADASDAGIYTLEYSGDCERPIRVSQNDVKRMFVRYHVRCRKCPPCLRARFRYWVAAAVDVTKTAMEEGNRTWFGTLTLKPDWQAELELRARAKHPTPNASWWDHTEPYEYRKRDGTLVKGEGYVCDERFQALRAEFLHEVQKYWKRLRKAGHAFKYFLVFERHKSGLPHAHWLLHEQGARIKKADLQSQWPQGFTKVVLVGGRSKRSGPPEKAAFYVAKYLSKDVQSRQIASRLYRPKSRASS